MPLLLRGMKISLLPLVGVLIRHAALSISSLIVRHSCLGLSGSSPKLSRRKRQSVVGC